MDEHGMNHEKRVKVVGLLEVVDGKREGVDDKRQLAYEQ